ncbi:hypothetical protein RhiirA4_424972 [Rhizophagus irregularis]|uniref:Uncharacterized protein n=1 Tax=Rhizophagus irregularis TaxID=588596 RepID=A0A2I1GZN1_9GLOM|nr:hypothetical protein RhiirA4_424972 [Rhizophagus irregularis]
MEEVVVRAVEGHIIEKEMIIKDNVNQSARELCKMMGLRLGTIDFSASNVNKERQMQVLFKEIQKTNTEKIVTQKISKSATVVKSVDEEEMVDIVNKYRKGASSVRFLEKGSDTNGHVTPDKVSDVINDFRKKEKTGEVPVSDEDISLYNKVDQVCSSRLPEIKKDEISEKDKIGQKRCSKEELSRRSVRSDETDEESGSKILLQ